MSAPAPVLIGAVSAVAGATSVAVAVVSLESRVVAGLGGVRVTGLPTGGALALPHTAVSAAGQVAPTAAAPAGTVVLSPAGRLVASSPASLRVGANAVSPSFSPLVAVAFALTAAQLANVDPASLVRDFARTGSAAGFGVLPHAVLLGVGAASARALNLRGTVSGLAPGQSYTVVVAAADPVYLASGTSALPVTTASEPAVGALSADLVLRTVASLVARISDPDSGYRAALGVYPAGGGADSNERADAVAAWLREARWPLAPAGTAPVSDPFADPPALLLPPGATCGADGLGVGGGAGAVLAAGLTAVLREPHFALGATVTPQWAGAPAAGDGTIVCASVLGGALAVELTETRFEVRAPGGPALLSYPHPLAAAAPAAASFRLLGDRAAGALTLIWNGAVVASTSLAARFWTAGTDDAWQGLGLGGLPVYGETGDWSLAAAPSNAYAVRGLEVSPVGGRALPPILLRSDGGQGSTEARWALCNLAPSTAYEAVAVASDYVTHRGPFSATSFTTLDLPDMRVVFVERKYTGLRPYWTLETDYGFDDTLLTGLYPAASNPADWFAAPYLADHYGSNATDTHPGAPLITNQNRAFTPLASGSQHWFLYRLVSRWPGGGEPAVTFAGSNLLTVRQRPALSLADLRVSQLNVRADYAISSVAPVRLCVAAVPNTFVASQDATTFNALTSGNTGNNALFVNSTTAASGTFSYQAPVSSLALTPGAPYKLYAVAFEAAAYAADSLVRPAVRADYVTGLALPFTACNLPQLTSLTVTVGQNPVSDALYARVQVGVETEAACQFHAWVQATDSPSTFSDADYTPAWPIARADFVSLTDEQRVSASSSNGLIALAAELDESVSFVTTPLETAPLLEDTASSPEWYAAVSVLTTEEGQGYGALDRYVLSHSHQVFKSIALTDLYVYARELGATTATYDVALRDLDTGFAVYHALFAGTPTQQQLQDFYTYGSLYTGAVTAAADSTFLGAGQTDLNTHRDGTSVSVINLTPYTTYTVAVLVQDSVGAASFVNSATTTFRTFALPRIALSSVREEEDGVTLVADCEDAWTTAPGGGADSANSKMMYHVFGGTYNGANVAADVATAARFAHEYTSPATPATAAAPRLYQTPLLRFGGLTAGQTYLLAATVESRATHTYTMRDFADIRHSAQCNVQVTLLAAAATRTFVTRVPTALTLLGGDYSPAAAMDPFTGVRAREVPFVLRVLDPDMGRPPGNLDTLDLALEVRAGHPTVDAALALQVAQGGFGAAPAFRYTATSVGGAAAFGYSNAAPTNDALIPNAPYTVVATASDTASGLLTAFAGFATYTRALPTVSLSNLLLAREHADFRLTVDYSDADDSRANSFDVSLTAVRPFMFPNSWILPGATPSNLYDPRIPVLDMAGAALPAASNARYETYRAAALQPLTPYEAVYELRDLGTGARLAGALPFTTRAAPALSVAPLLAGSSNLSYSLFAALADAVPGSRTFSVRALAVPSAALGLPSASNAYDPAFAAALFLAGTNPTVTQLTAGRAIPLSVNGAFDGLLPLTPYHVFAQLVDDSPPHETAHAFFETATSSSPPTITVRSHTNSDDAVTVFLEVNDTDSAFTLYYRTYDPAQVPPDVATDPAQLAAHMASAQQRSYSASSVATFTSVSIQGLAPATPYVVVVVAVDTTGGVVARTHNVLTLATQSYLDEAEYLDGDWELVWRRDAFYTRAVKGPNLANGKLAIVPSLTRVGCDRAFLAGEYRTSSPFGGFTNNIVETFDAAGFSFGAPSASPAAVPARIDRVTLNLRNCLARAEGAAPGAADALLAEYLPLRDVPYCHLTTLRFSSSNASAAPQLLYHEMRAPAAAGLVSPEFEATLVHDLASPVVLFTGTARVLNDTVTIACACAYLFDDGVSARHLGHDYYVGTATSFNAFEVTKDPAAASRLSGVTVITAHASSRDFERPLHEAMRIALTAARPRRARPGAQATAQRLRDDHVARWDALWSSGVSLQGRGTTLPDIESVESIRRSLRLAAFDLHCSVRDTTGVEADPAAAEGLDFDGTMHWNRETWVVPALIYLRPRAAKELLSRRHEALGRARALAFSQGRQGARFEHGADIRGLTARTPYWDVASSAYVFNSAMVAVATWDCYRVTQDRDWLYQRGYGILSSVADYICSSVSYSNYVGDDGGTREVASFGDVLDVNGETVRDSCLTLHTARLALQGALEASYHLRYASPPAWERAFLAARVSFLFAPPASPIVRYHADFTLADSGLRILEPLILLHPHHVGRFTDASTLGPEALDANVSFYTAAARPEYVSNANNRLAALNVYALLATAQGAARTYFDLEDIPTQLVASLEGAKSDVWGALRASPADAGEFNDIGLSAQLLLLFICGYAGVRVQGGFNTSGTNYATLGLRAQSLTAWLPRAWRSVEFKSEAPVTVSTGSLGGTLVGGTFAVTNSSAPPP